MVVTICCCLQTCNLIRCHGDDVINMCTKFHLHIYILFRSEEVILKKTA